MTVREKMKNYIKKVPDFWGNKEKYFEHSWVKVPKPWIDPAKEATANKVALETGQKTFKDIAAESGKDWRQAIDDMAEAQEYANKRGVKIGGGINAVQQESSAANSGDNNHTSA